MSNEVGFNPEQQAKNLEARFNQLVQERNQMMQRRSEMDRRLNEIGMEILKLQGAYEMAMLAQGKDIEGNQLEVPPAPKKEEKKEVKETSVKKRKSTKK
jgi:hypothetical protein